VPEHDLDYVAAPAPQPLDEQIVCRLGDHDERVDHPNRVGEWTRMNT
jgi:hypothetical protein